MDLNTFGKSKIALITFLLAIISLSGCDKIKDLPVAKGYTAKQLCSYVFNSGIDSDHVLDVFIAPKVQPFPLIWRVYVDYDEQSIVVGDRILGSKFAGAKAVYRDGLGCTLLTDKTEDEVLTQEFTPLPAPSLPTDIPWPLGSAGLYPETIPGLDVAAVNAAVESAFAETSSTPKNTTSVLVVYDGKLIAEKYAQGLTQDRPWGGWSMCKTVVGGLVGILQDQGLVDIDQPAPIPGWSGTGKENITTRHLMHMSSGLAFNEDYEGLSDISKMLYLKSDQAAYAASRPQAETPGEVFSYASGDTTLLAKIVQDTVGGTLQNTYEFYQTQLFHKIGVTSALFEVDASGQFLPATSCAMTARDWARVALLYLQKGQWNGEQVISSEWIDFVTSPSPAKYYYGGQIWLNTDGDEGSEWPSLPRDAFLLSGHQGQLGIVIPSKNLVVVRTGVTEEYMDVNEEEFVSAIVAALPELSVSSN